MQRHHDHHHRTGETAPTRTVRHSAPPETRRVTFSFLSALDARRRVKAVKVFDSCWGTKRSKFASVSRAALRRGAVCAPVLNQKLEARFPPSPEQLEAIPGAPAVNGPGPDTDEPLHPQTRAERRGARPRVGGGKGGGGVHHPPLCGLFWPGNGAGGCNGKPAESEV